MNNKFILEAHYVIFNKMEYLSVNILLTRKIHLKSIWAIKIK